MSDSNPRVVPHPEKSGVFFVETHTGFVTEPTGFPREFSKKQAEEFIEKTRKVNDAVQQKSKC